MQSFSVALDLYMPRGRKLVARGREPSGVLLSRSGVPGAGGGRTDDCVGVDEKRVAMQSSI